jgi:mannose-6-phosphate isomerase-like protein (cupin superfamily)
MQAQQGIDSSLKRTVIPNIPSITAAAISSPRTMLAILTLTLTLTSTLVLGDIPVDPQLSRNLEASLQWVDFWNQLSDSDFLFDFSQVLLDPYKPGSVINANAVTWPLMIGSGMMVAQLNLGPCSMLAPHAHPRAHNVVVSVSGSTKTYMRAENGARDRVTHLTPGKATLFPSGSMHAMVNEGEYSFPLSVLAFGAPDSTRPVCESASCVHETEES